MNCQFVKKKLCTVDFIASKSSHKHKPFMTIYSLAINNGINLIEPITVDFKQLRSQ